MLQLSFELMPSRTLVTRPARPSKNHFGAARIFFEKKKIRKEKENKKCLVDTNAKSKKSKEHSFIILVKAKLVVCGIPAG